VTWLGHARHSPYGEIFSVSVEAIHNPLDALTPGGLVGPYLLLAPLGVGGSGWVWAAARLEPRGTPKRTAIKIMLPDTLGSLSSQQRFAREAQLGAELRHANIRTVYELNEQDGLPYMAMRWAETSLNELLSHAPDQRLEPELTCWFGLQCCWALAAIHGHSSPEQAARDGRTSNRPGPGGRAAPTVHRDVSPDNVLLTVDGQVLLCDLAATANDTADVHASAADGLFFGKPAYASPEALRELPVDGRSDLFSLGCTLYQALAGQRPFDADDEHSIVYQILEQDPPELAQLCPDAPLALIAVVERALAKDADRRFQTAEAMAHELAKCVAGVSGLEERAAATIRAVLGDRLRDREQAMQAVFRRWAPSLEERPEPAPRAGVGQKPTPEPGVVIPPRTASTPETGASRSAPHAARLGALGTVVATLAMLLVGAALGWFVTRSRPAFPPAQAVLAQATGERSRGAAAPVGAERARAEPRPEPPAGSAPSDAPTPIPPSVALSTPSPSTAVTAISSPAPLAGAAPTARRPVAAARPAPAPAKPAGRLVKDLRQLTAEAQLTEPAAPISGSATPEVPAVPMDQDNPYGSEPPAKPQ
jgi:serine/threonine-protein kinase